jgi:hypothetical protein
MTGKDNEMRNATEQENEGSRPPGWPPWVAAKGCDVFGDANQKVPGMYYLQCRPCGKRTRAIDLPPGCTLTAPPDACPACGRSGDPERDLLAQTVLDTFGDFARAVAALGGVLNDPAVRHEAALRVVADGLDGLLEDLRHPLRWGGLGDKIRHLRAVARVGLMGQP